MKLVLVCGWILILFMLLDKLRNIENEVQIFRKCATHVYVRLLPRVYGYKNRHMPVWYGI